MARGRRAYGDRSGRAAGGYRDLALVLAGLILLAVAAVVIERAGVETIQGMARVIDGDTLAIGSQRLRLMGIDAPEIGQRCMKDGFSYPCGVEAASFLRGLIGRAEARCTIGGTDRYRRLLGQCKAGSLDLNATMVREGHAVSYGGYRSEEQAAKAERAGLWAGAFDQPQAWRAVHGGLDETPHAADVFGRIIEWVSGLYRRDG